MLKFTAHKFYPGLTGCQRRRINPLSAFQRRVQSHQAILYRPQAAIPRTLVAPLRMVVMGTPQFNPEFFLYDFLFVYGAAFKPQLASERLRLVMPSDRASAILKALRLTLTGLPSLSLRAIQTPQETAPFRKKTPSNSRASPTSWRLNKGTNHALWRRWSNQSPSTPETSSPFSMAILRLDEMITGSRSSTVPGRAK